MAATKHFILRAQERMGVAPEQALELARSVIWAVRNDRRDMVEFIARVNRKGCRIFRFEAAPGRFFYALVDTDAMCCVTVLPPGFRVNREGKQAVRLKETDG